MTTTTKPTFGGSDYALRFGVIAVVVAAVLAVLAPLRDALITLTVWSVESSARLVHLDAYTGAGGLITFASPAGGAFSYRIVEECTAAAVVGLFTVAVLAVPRVAWRRRAIGVVVGSVALLAANWVRLLSLAWLGVHKPATFDLAHVWLWQIVSVALVVMAWLVWIQWATGHSSDGAVRRRLAWFAGATVLSGAILQLTGLDQAYSYGIDRGVQGAQYALDALPYRTVSIAAPATEWTMHVRGASLALAVALTMALTGPSARRRLASGALALPLVFVAHLIGKLIEASSDARLGPAGATTVGPYVQIPLLVIVHGLPTLVPLALWYRTTAKNTTTITA